MVRIIGFLAGVVFVVALIVAAVMPREATPADPNAKYHKHPIQADWSFKGPLNMGIFGTFDRAQLQRGYQVYKQVCANCHGMKRVAFRNLTDIGFSEAEVKALAKQADIPSIDEKTGEPTTRKGIPSDRLPSPYPNDIAARAAQNNALPPDLSLITKARHDGANYVYSLLTGYGTPPKSVELSPGLHYNPYFHSLGIAMAPPLVEGVVEYAEGQPKATVDQMARDVTAFLAWAAEPEMEERKRTGFAVIIFLLITTGLAYVAYRKVWADVKGH